MEVVIQVDGTTEDEVTARHDLPIFQAIRRIIQAVELYSRKLSAAHKITALQLISLLTKPSKKPSHSPWSGQLN
ncbi:MAG: hypothetical protein ACE5MM_01650 [Nitrospiraceae bacterium]